jgi:hypothetical protein
MKGCRREGYTDLVSAVDANVVVLEDAYVERKLTISYLELPLHFVFNIPIKKNYFNIGVGPYIAYGIAGKNKNHYSYNGESIDDATIISSSLKYNLFSGEKKCYNPLDYGLNGFVGFSFSNGLIVKAGYSLGLANISLDTKYLEENVKNNHFYLSLGISF